MATITGSVEQWSSRYEYYITWSEYNVNIANNTSDVTATAYVRKYSTAINSEGYATNHSITVDGTSATATTYLDMNPETTAIAIVTVAKTISHNADGTKQIYISSGTALNNSGGYGPKSGSAGATVTLYTIPREAYVTSSTDFTIGNNLALTLSNPGNMYVRSSLYVNSTLIRTTDHGITSSPTITLGGAYDTAMYAQMTSVTSVANYVRIQTYSDAGYTVQVGGNRDTAGTTSVNTATNVPTFTTYTVASVDKTISVTDKYANALATSYTNTLTGSAQKIISGYSKLRGTITAANKMVALNSATAVKYRFGNGSQATDGTYSAGSTVDIDIDNVTAVATTMTAYDSRALTTAATPVSVTSMVSYTTPVLSAVTITRDNRIDALSTLVIAGSYWKEYFGGGVAGVQNTITAHYRYKETTASWAAQSWSSITLTDSSGALSYSAHIDGDLGGSGFTTTKSYSIEVRIYDKITSFILEGTLDRGVPLMDWTQDGIAIGTTYDSSRGGLLQVAQPAWTAVSFENSWVNFDSSNYTAGSYMKDSLGFVHLRGLVKTGTIGTTIFTLPSGYRPAKHHHFGVASNGAFGYCYITNAGAVQASGGSNTWFSLDGIRFSTA